AIVVVETAVLRIGAAWVYYGPQRTVVGRLPLWTPFTYVSFLFAIAAGGGGAVPQRRGRRGPGRLAGLRRPRGAVRLRAQPALPVRRSNRDDPGQFEDAGRREVLFGDAHAEVGEGVLDGVGEGGGGADHAPFADAPVVGEDVGAGLEVVDLDVGDLGGGGDEVVHERAGLELALVVVGRLLVEDGADALGDAAPDLAVDDGRVDDLAAVFDDDVAGDLHHSGLEVDLDDAGMGGLGPAALPAVEDPPHPDGLSVTGGAPDIGTVVAGGGGDVGQGDGDGRGAGHVDAAAFDGEVAGGGLEEVGRDLHDPPA